MIEYVDLQHKAYNYLKEMILNNQLLSDVVYSETKVAKEIGISRTPMRDAVKVLAQEGFVDRIPSKGFVLHDLSLKDMIEIFQIRCAIEGFCCLQITKEIDSRRTKGVVTILDDLLVRQNQVLNKTKSIVEFTEYDDRFHQEIVLSSKNSTMIEMYYNFTSRISRQTQISLTLKNRMENAYIEHQKILDTMKTGDTDHIYGIIMAHLEQALHIIPHLKQMQNRNE